MTSGTFEHAWWNDLSDEIYWLEVTERDDLGADLRAPQVDDSGKEYWSYALVTAVRDGDVVFHYAKRTQEIRLWSIAEGGWWQDEIYWGARGTVGRGHDPYDRPGWRYGLRGPFELAEPVTLDDIRSSEPDLRRVRDRLEAEHGRPLYFPFEIGTRRPLRTAQGYLFKFPSETVAALPGLKRPAIPIPRGQTQRVRIDSSLLGVTYRRENEDIAGGKRDPFSVDPSVIERGLRGHRRAQNLLADYVETLGAVPRSPQPSEPAYDLAWEKAGKLWVAEVKSLTRKNEERQLRLGLGQVLRYRSLFEPAGRPVQAVLFAERRPRDPSWSALCETLDVILAWPESVAVLRAPNKKRVWGIVVVDGVYGETFGQ